MPVRAALPVALPVRPIAALLAANLWFSGHSFDHVRLGFLAFTAIAAAVARTAVTFLAFAVGRRRDIGSHRLSVRNGCRRFACGLAFGLGARPFVTAAAAPFAVAGAALTGWTPGPPHLDHLGLSGYCCRLR